MFHSAYCGGLWLASLVVMCKMARLLENDAKHQYYRDLLDRGSAAFDKLLWNGKIITREVRYYRPIKINIGTQKCVYR